MNTPAAELLRLAATIACALCVPCRAGAFEDFADSLQSALSRGDSAFVNSHVSVLAVQSESQIPPELSEDILGGMRHLGTTVVTQAGDKPDYDLRSIRASGSRKAALYRAHGAQGLTYFEVTLAQEGESVVIVDWCNTLTGFSYSSAVGDLIGLLRQHANRWGGVDLQENAPPARLVTAMQQLGAGDAAGALNTLSSLPPDIAKLRVAVGARIVAGQLLGQTALTRVCAWIASDRALAERYPLLLHDYYVAQGKYRKARKTVDVVEAQVGADGALQAMRAADLAARGRVGQALDAYADAVEREASYEPVYWTLLDLLVAQEEFADATLVLDVLTVKFGYSFDVEKLSEVSGFEKLIKSREFRDWARTVE
jgi:hypothetical protein